METSAQLMTYGFGARAPAITQLDDIDELVRLYRPKVLRYVMFQTGDVDMAETIATDCFLKAHAGRASFRGDCAVSTWLISIAANLVRDHTRTKKFQFWKRFGTVAVDATEMADHIGSRATSPEQSVLAKEMVAQVHRTVENLSEKQRAVFVLRFIEEMDLPEIAEATGMNLNTVKTHLHRAVTAVRRDVGGRP